MIEVHDVVWVDDTTISAWNTRLLFLQPSSYVGIASLGSIYVRLLVGSVVLLRTLSHAFLAHIRLDTGLFVLPWEVIERKCLPALVTGSRAHPATIAQFSQGVALDGALGGSRTHATKFRRLGA